MHAPKQLARLVLLLLVLSLVLITNSTAPAAAAPNIPGDENWLVGPTLGGINGRVDAMAVGDGGSLYIGGNFTAAGNIPVRHIAKWNGTAWSPVGFGVPGAVSAMVWDVTSSSLYVGGSFAEICKNPECSVRDTVNYIARWNPATGSWSALDHGVSGSVESLAMGPGGTLYAGGDINKACSDFSCSAAGTTAHGVAMWDPAGAGTWSSLTDSGGWEGVTGSVLALAWWSGSFGNYLVVGGSISTAGNKAVNHIAMWSPAPVSTWSPFWGGVNGTVFALAVDSTNDPAKPSIAVGGNFTNTCQPFVAGCIPFARVNNLAASIGFDWFGPLGYGLMSSGEVAVKSITIDAPHKRLYAAGDIGGYCTDLTCSTFTTVNHIAQWDYSSPPGSWSSPDTGINDFVQVLAWNPTSDVLYAGGMFSKAGDIVTGGLAAWNGTAWSGFGSGSGTTPWIYSIAADRSGRIYVGGNIVLPGNSNVNHIAMWDTTSNTWSALGNGLDLYPHDMVVATDGTLYAVGQISRICSGANCWSGGTKVNNVVKWTPDGSSGAWSSVGYGLSSNAFSLAFDRSGNLYVGGWNGIKICNDMNCAAPTQGANVVKWDGSAWSPVGDYLKGGVFALGFDRDDTLYAAGNFEFKCTDFTCATNGTQVNNIARLPAGGTAWQPVGNGVDWLIRDMVIDASNNVYVGGPFTHLCDGPTCAVKTVHANGAARWNGSWSPLGNGVQGFIETMALDDRGHLYGAGDFHNMCADSACTAAGATVNRIARWDGSAWSGLGSGIGPTIASDVASMVYRAPYIIVGGSFATAGDKLSANIARYNAGAYLFLPFVKR